MVETQVIFRLDKKLLKEFDKVEGLEEKDIEEMVNRWRSEKNK
ncbi:MAG: hypothetical protein OIN84_09090 [Candidatus Methanoperedens sp.]|nr:hypothetical protein [Candidatus Methanoperedens sp.]